MNQTTAWAVRVNWRPGGALAMDTIRRTRQESIAAWAACFDSHAEGMRYWRRLRRIGRVACVRVAVREVEA